MQQDQVPQSNPFFLLFRSNPRSTIYRAKANSPQHVKALSVAMQADLCPWPANLLPIAIDAFACVLEQLKRGRSPSPETSRRDTIMACVLGLVNVEDTTYHAHPNLRFRVISSWPFVWDSIKLLDSHSPDNGSTCCSEEVDAEDMAICKIYQYFTSRRNLEPEFARVDLENRCGEAEEELRLFTKIWFRFVSRANMLDIKIRFMYEQWLMNCLYTSAERFEKRVTVLGGPFNSIWAVMCEAGLAEDKTGTDMIKLAVRRLRKAIKSDYPLQTKLHFVYLNIRFLIPLSHARDRRSEDEVRVINQCLIRERAVELALDSISLATSSLAETTSLDIPSSILTASFRTLLNIFVGDHGVSALRKAINHNPGLIEALASVTMPSSPAIKLATFSSIYYTTHKILGIILIRYLRIASILSAIHPAIVKCPALVSYCEDTLSAMKKFKSMGLSERDDLARLAFCWAHLYDEIKHRNADFERLTMERKHEVIICSNIDCDVKGTRSAFLTCADCLSVLYCSPACQKSAWREHDHKAECHRLQTLQATTGLSARDTRYLSLFAQESMRFGLSKAMMKFFSTHASPAPPKDGNSIRSDEDIAIIASRDGYTRSFNVALRVNYGMRLSATTDGFFLPSESVEVIPLPLEMASNSPAPSFNPGSDPETTFVYAFLRRWGIPLNSQRPLHVKPVLTTPPGSERSAAEDKEMECRALTVTTDEKGWDVSYPVLVSDPSPRPSLASYSSEATDALKSEFPGILPVQVVHQLGRSEHVFYVSGASFSEKEYKGHVCGCCQICGLKDQDGEAPALPVHVLPRCPQHSHLYVRSVT